MRYILIAIAILFLPLSIMAGQITFNLDRCVVLNSLSHQDADSKVALHFTLPEELSGKEIMYAELTFILPPLRLQADSLFEIRFYPLLAEWSEGDISFDNSDAITDSMSAGLFTAKLADTNSFHFDFTEYIRETVERTRANFGLIGQADLLGDNHIRLPDNLNIPIMNQARIKVVYK